GKGFPKRAHAAAGFGVEVIRENCPMRTASPAHHRQNQPNLFAFPSETDVRFLLLVLVAAGSTLGLGMYVADTVLGYVLPSATASSSHFFVSFLSAMILVFLVFGLAWRRAAHAATDLIQRKNWQRFPPPHHDAAERDSLQQMNDYLRQLMARL